MRDQQEEHDDQARGDGVPGVGHGDLPHLLTGLSQRKAEMMEPRDVSKEAWREYDFGGRIYRIAAPQTLWIGTTTHRVLDSDGVVHCVPAPGECGCALRWKPKDATEPVQF